MPEAGGKLRILALHSWRTSGSIFIEQMRRAGLDKALADMVEITYVDAPNDASGPPPEDVKPFFQGPYKEWWSAQQVSHCALHQLVLSHVQQPQHHLLAAKQQSSGGGNSTTDSLQQPSCTQA